MLKKLTYLLGAIAIFAVSTCATVPSFDKTSFKSSNKNSNYLTGFVAGTDVDYGTTLEKNHVVLTANGGTWYDEGTSTWTIGPGENFKCSKDEGRGEIKDIVIQFESGESLLTVTGGGTYTYDSSTHIGEWTGSSYSVNFTNKSDTDSIKMKVIEVTHDQKYKVTFDITLGDPEYPVDPQFVEDGGLVEVPDDPYRYPYVFLGWYTDTTYTTKWNFDTDTVSEDITLYANWEIWHQITWSYGVTFNLKETYIRTYKDGTKIKKPSNPVQEGYTFLGWYYWYDNETTPSFTIPWNFNTPINHSFWLEAKYLSTPQGKGVGGYMTKDGTKQQIVGFGFTFKDYAYLESGDKFCVCVYSDAGETLVKEFSGTNILLLKENEGRFYCTYDCAKEGMTYYAKAYVKAHSLAPEDDYVVWSDVVSATGNYDTEYYI